MTLKSHLKKINDSLISIHKIKIFIVEFLGNLGPTCKDRNNTRVLKNPYFIKLVLLAYTGTVGPISQKVQFCNNIKTFFVILRRENEFLLTFKARKKNLKWTFLVILAHCDRTVHAGEDGPSENVKIAIEQMYAERIGHGYRVMQDQELYDKCLKEYNIHFEACIPCPAHKSLEI